jgi:hypothetical protein
VLYKWLHGYIQPSNLSSALSMPFNFLHVNLANYFAKIANVRLGNQIFDRIFLHEVSPTNLSEKEPFDLKNYFSKNECALQLEKNRENAWFKNHLKMTI